ncbi:MAG TPA: alpha/beta fold hydrolase [Pseudonocardiaceae bacterium]|jgi:pimeloyl-ACP methyl ester carboxylesterase|nr:alpha/beta fold hydrolase [Pseudonocardiaceae bacterium]
MPHALTRDGTRIAYQVQGSGPALVLLAGQSNSHHWWDGVREDFDEDHTTISIDYRGTGDSDKPDEPYGTRGFATDVLAVLDDLGLDDAAVYGTSMGGRVAQWLAVDQPRRVRALILGCTSPGGPHSVERDNAVRVSLAQPGTREGRQALIDLMFTPAWSAAHPGRYTVLGDPRMPPYARKRHLLASNGHNAWDVLPDITAPTLILHGTDDLLNPTANATLLAERIQDARVELIEGARHAYFVEFRDLAGRMVLEFLREVG